MAGRVEVIRGKEAPLAAFPHSSGASGGTEALDPGKPHGAAREGAVAVDVRRLVGAVLFGDATGVHHCRHVASVKSGMAAVSTATITKRPARANSSRQRIMSPRPRFQMHKRITNSRNFRAFSWCRSARSAGDHTPARVMNVCEASCTFDDDCWTNLSDGVDEYENRKVMLFFDVKVVE
jgi:hypothetical protein